MIYEKLENYFKNFLIYQSRIMQELLLYIYIYINGHVLNLFFFPLFLWVLHADLD